MTATDADDPTYGNSARVVYSILHGQPYFSVDPKTGEALIPLCIKCVKFMNIFVFYSKMHETDVSEKKCLCFMCTLAIAARQSCSEIRLSRSLVLNDMSDWVSSKQPTSGTIHQDKKTGLSTEPWDTKGHKKKTVKYLFDLTQFRRSPLSVRVIYDIRDLKYLFQRAQDKRTDVKFLLVMAAHNVLGWICGMSSLFATYQNVR